jgi:hypothetical protein
MGVLTLEVGYTSAVTGRGDHEVHKGHVVAMERNKNFLAQFVTHTQHTSYFSSIAKKDNEQSTSL